MFHRTCQLVRPFHFHRTWVLHSQTRDEVARWNWPQSTLGVWGHVHQAKLSALWRFHFYSTQRLRYAGPWSHQPPGQVSPTTRWPDEKTQADLGEAAPELPLGSAGRSLLWILLQGQGVQVEVLPGWAPVRLLQLGQRPVFKRGGVCVGAGPHPHQTRHAGAPRGGEGAHVAFFLITEETATSPGTVFFLQLWGFKNNFFVC